MRYLEGISLDAFGRGNRRMLAPVLAWAKEPVAVPVPEAAAEEPKAAEGEKPAKGSPARKPEKTPEPKTRRRVGVRHLGYAAGGAFFLWPVVGGWVPTVLTTAPAVWVVAALIAGQQGDHNPGAEDEDEDDDQEHDDQEVPEEKAPAPDRGMELLLHVIRDLSDAEFSKRAGVHLDVLLDSAVAAGHVPEGTEQTEFRAWLEAAGLPIEDKLGMRIEGKPVTRVGVRIDAATRALGMTPTQLLEARLKTLVQGPARVPVQAAPEAPAPALLRLIPGGLQPPSGASPLGSSQEGAQGVRQPGLSPL